MFIDDIFFLDSIFEIEKNISSDRNKPITNISHWNPSNAYMEMIMKSLSPQSVTNIFKYVYTYDIPIMTRNAIIKKLIGTYPDSQMCMILPNSTLAIINIVNYLKQNGFHRLFMLQPSYFSVEEACKLAEIEVVKIPLQYNKNKYEIPLDIVHVNAQDAVWITSPLYSTSYLLDQCIIQCIDYYTTNNRLVIIDESLNINGLETIRNLKHNKYLFGIYSPHKSIFCNGLKFSAIICDKTNDDFLEQWIDVIGGALPGSCINAVEHFLSPNFNLCNENAKEWFRHSKTTIIEILQKYPFASVDTVQSIGSYTTINIPYIPLRSLDFIKKMMSETLVSIIPGFINGNPNCSFRINLSLNQNTIGNSLNTLLNFISRQIS